MVVLQFFLAGVGLFGVSGMEWHMSLGYWVPLPALLMLFLAWPAHCDRRSVGLYAGLFLLLIVQTTLPALREVAPILAALHPPNALLIFGLTFVAARRATAHLRADTAEDRQAVASEDRAATPAGPADGLRDAIRRIVFQRSIARRECSHLKTVAVTAPDHQFCAACVEEDTRTVHLRMCLTCGEVSCCDSSPARHARRHHEQTGHPLIKSVEPGEEWAWCYIEEAYLTGVGG